MKLILLFAFLAVALAGSQSQLTPKDKTTIQKDIEASEKADQSRTAKCIHTSKDKRSLDEDYDGDTEAPKRRKCKKSKMPRNQFGHIMMTSRNPARG